MMMMMNGFYWENGNRDQNLVYEIQWECGLLTLYTIRILYLLYTTARFRRHDPSRNPRNPESDS